MNSNLQVEPAENVDSEAGEMRQMSGEMLKIHAMLTAGSTLDERDWRLPEEKRGVIFAALEKSEKVVPLVRGKQGRVPWVQILVATAACYVFGVFALWLFSVNRGSSNEAVAEQSPDFIFYLNQKNRQHRTPLTPNVPVVEPQEIAVAGVELVPEKPKAVKPVQLVPASDAVPVEENAIAREKWQKEEEARKERELLEQRLREKEPQRLAMPPVQQKP